MQPAELISSLRAAGDPLHLLAAEALVTLHTTAERLQERIHQLEAIARLNGETICNMQQAAAEARASKKP
jgi:hypothetical protein